MNDEQAMKFHYAEISGGYIDVDGVFRWYHICHFAPPIDQFLVGFFRLSGTSDLDDPGMFNWFGHHIYHGEALTDGIVPEEVQDAAIMSGCSIHRIIAFDADDKSYAWWYVQRKFHNAASSLTDGATMLASKENENDSASSISSSEADFIEGIIDALDANDIELLERSELKTRWRAELLGRICDLLKRAEGHYNISNELDSIGDKLKSADGEIDDARDAIKRLIDEARQRCYTLLDDV